MSESWIYSINDLVFMEGYTKHANKVIICDKLKKKYIFRIGTVKTSVILKCELEVAREQPCRAD